jgi:hypothetical protein
MSLAAQNEKSPRTASAYHGKLAAVKRHIHGADWLGKFCGIADVGLMYLIRDRNSVVK